MRISDWSSDVCSSDLASRDDDSFAVFRLPDGAYAGGFRIRGGAIDGTEDTDGIALHAGDFGEAWPGGLFAAQDGKNRDDTDEKAPQNFKLVPLGDISRALGLGATRNWERQLWGGGMRYRTSRNIRENGVE